MRVFVAGATGAIGRRLVPLLVDAGYDVTASTRSLVYKPLLRSMGARPAIMDGLDRAAVINAVSMSAPDVVVHEMTGLDGIKSMRNFDKEFAQTNRLRTAGTDNLLDAAREAGASQFVAQSFGNWNYERTGSELKTETDPLDPDPPLNQQWSVGALQYLERAVLDADRLTGVVLRYGNFYGPGTGFAVDGEIADLLRKRAFPLVGDGGGVWSFIHVDDAAAATVAAIQRGAAGVYNICDDDPAPIAEWLPALAHELGAKPPRHVPTWLGRIAAGDVGVSVMTRIRGASNAKAKRELQWRPAYSSWREGFRDALGAVPSSAAAA
jgi:nucleoside-diphosphate-sugar epimerase